MGKRSRLSNQAEEEYNIWPSFTDLMSNAFMIITLFLFLALFKSLFLKLTADETELDLSQSQALVRQLRLRISSLEQQVGDKTSQVKELKSEYDSLETKFANIQNELETTESELTKSKGEVNSLEDRLAQNKSQFDSLEDKLQKSNLQVSDLKTEVKRLKSAPPVVVIQGSGEFQFQSGSATLPPKLARYIANDLVDRIEEVTQERGVYVVEVIGNTDGQITRGTSNLDQQLISVARGTVPIDNLKPGSNADLGLMRALAVVKELQKVQEKGRLKDIQFRAYSGAQLYLPSGKFAPNSQQASPERRRIEIRFSPLGQAENIQ